MNRLNPLSQPVPIIGKVAEAIPEMRSVDQLQAQLKDVMFKGDQIIKEATEEILKRNACLAEGVRIMRECRQVLIKGTDVESLTKLLEDIDKWAGAEEVKNDVP